MGGAEVATGTLPSKTLKETALYISGKFEKGLYGVERELRHEASIDDFMFRKNFVSAAFAKDIKDNLVAHKVDIYHGIASFIDSHTIQVEGALQEKLYGDYIIIATGSYPHHPDNIPFDGDRIHDSDTILKITRYPKSLCVVGAGVIGCEYATIFSTIGTHVYLVNDKEKILPFIDSEVSSSLVSIMQDEGIDILFNSSVESIKPAKSPNELIDIRLKGEQTLNVDMFLFAAGRSGATQELKLEALGIQMGKRGTIIVDENYRTNIPHIYAVGDVIGFPALASTSINQGRVAVAHIFKTEDLENLPSIFPYGIYTVPEVSMAGKTEEEVKEAGIPYCVGKARYSDMARGMIIGATSGFLKLVFHRETKVILGVHVIGHIATEIIHFGVLR